MRPSRILGEIAAAASLSALLFACGVFLPLVGPPAGFLATAPLVWVTWRGGLLPGAIAAGLASVVLLPLLPPPAVLVFLVEHGVAGWMLGALFGRGLFRAAVMTAVAVTALLLTGAASLTGPGVRNPSIFFEAQLRAALTEMSERGGEHGGEEASEELISGLEPLLAWMRRVFPALALIGIFLECALNGLLALKALSQSPPSGRPPPGSPELMGFALPEAAVWMLIPALALVWSPWERVTTAAMNVVLPLLTLYLLQGLSILLHLAVRSRISRIGRFLFGTAMLFQPYLLAVPLLLGLVDFRFGFRSRWPLDPPGAA